jgi:c(7)-type cytochrome triheme protein
MKFRLCIFGLLLLTLPSVLYARWEKSLVEIENDATGVIAFDHYNHFDALGEKKCPTCHNGIFNRDMSKNPDFTMQDMEKGKACGACHNGERAFSVKEDCSSCHPTRDITFKVPDAGPVVFSHEVHTGMYSCSECHPGIFIPGAGNKKATMDEMAGGAACGACHDGSTAFTVEDNCDSCHQM